jgi:hypothetical protein
LSSFSSADGSAGREVGRTPSAADIAVRRLLRLHDWHSSLDVLQQTVTSSPIATSSAERSTTRAHPVMRTRQFHISIPGPEMLPAFLHE